MNLSPTEDKLCGQSSWSPSESSSGRASFSNGNCAERFAQKELAQQIVCDENAEEEVVAPSDSDEPAQPGPEKVIPANEAERLAALNSLGLAFDNAPDPRFDSITTLMKSIFQTPVSAITLIREDAIYMHSRAGQWACTAPRKGSFCDFVLDGACARMVIVEDALADDRFKVNRFVAGPPHVRFYAGAPLVGRSGERYGTLCVIDFVPRKFTSEQYQIVANFAEVATRELERQRVSHFKGGTAMVPA